MAVVLDAQKQVQIGDETTWGTAVAPTVELSGITDISIPKSVVTEIVQAARGGIVPGRDTVDVRHEVDGASIGGWMIYGQICYILDGLDEDAAPGGAGPYTRQYDGPTTAQPSPRPQTLVAGPTNLSQGLNGMRVKSITFNWNWGEGVTWTADLMGYSVSNDAFAALDEAAGSTLTYALAAHLTVSVDVLAGTIGGTDIDEIQSGSITIDCQRKYNGRLGSLYPADTYDWFWNVTGEIVFENSATTAAFVNSVIGGATTKLLQLDFNNGEAGADERAMVFQMASEIDFGDTVGTDSDGMSVITMMFKPIEEGDWTTVPTGEIDGYFQLVNTSGIATLY